MDFVDYENTNHVRLYQIGDLAEWRALPWQARAVYLGLRMYVDEEGVIEIGFGDHPDHGVAALLRMPQEVAQGVWDLIDRGHLSWSREQGLLLDMAHVAGEKASWTGPFRKRQARQRQKAKEMRERRVAAAGCLEFPDRRGTATGRGVPQAGTPRPVFSGTPRPENGTPRPAHVTPRPVFGTPRPAHVTPRPENGTPRPVLRDTASRFSSIDGVDVAAVDRSTTTGGVATAAATAIAVAHDPGPDPEHAAYQAEVARIVAELWNGRRLHHTEPAYIQGWFENGIPIEYVRNLLVSRFTRKRIDGQLKLFPPPDNGDEETGKPVRFLGFFNDDIVFGWHARGVAATDPAAIESAEAGQAPECDSEPEWEAYLAKWTAILEELLGHAPKPPEEEHIRRFFAKGVDPDFCYFEVLLPKFEAGTEGRTLGYFVGDILSGHARVSKLLAPARAVAIEEPPPPALEERLLVIADRLPERLPNRPEWVSTILGLQGEPLVIDEELSRIELEILQELRTVLSETEAAALRNAEESAFAAMSHRLRSEGEQQRFRQRIRAQLLRDHFDVPTLSVVFEDVR